jgi:diadenosine tetraphosphatase ApaH/serine/threonine PP2A family protein phosphatase
VSASAAAPRRERGGSPGPDPVRYAVLSDVHGNAEALAAVLADADGQGARDVLCLGDTVGYGAEPVACLETIGDRAAAVVAGNHEQGAAGLMDLAWFNPTARAATVWTRARLGSDHRHYLTRLPLLATVGEACLVHASPDHPEEWEYLVFPEDGFGAFGAFASRLCFVGHSHVPAVWSLGSSGPDFTGRFAAWPHRIRLEAGRRYLINVGSVGQPRDRDPRAAYAVWDVDAGVVTIRRVVYDTEATARKILAAGLPAVLAERLAGGR